MGPLFRPFILFGCVAMMGCVKWTEDREEELRVLETRRVTGVSGVARVKIPLTAADKAMLLTVTPPAGFRSYVTGLEDQDGNVLYEFVDDLQRSRQPTGAAYASDLTVLNWPIESDQAFLAGEEVVALVAAVDGSDTLNANVTLDIEVLLKADTDWEAGELYVNLFYAGDVAQDDEMKAAVTEALEYTKEVYSDAGLQLSIETKVWSEGTLPKPGTGSPGEFEALSSESRLRTVNIVVVPSIYGSEELLGSAGSIPGPLSSTDRSAVLVSAVANAGPDLDYDEVEVRLLGETMAHEIGHYLGLFHPVENSWDRWDALSDTEDCDDLQVCEDQLGTNVMFPYPVCENNICEIQDSLTLEQQAVIQRYTGVW
jgi:hypothetical protein